MRKARRQEDIEIEAGTSPATTRDIAQYPYWGRQLLEIRDEYTAPSRRRSSSGLWTSASPTSDIRSGLRWRRWPLHSCLVSFSQLPGLSKYSNVESRNEIQLKLSDGLLRSRIIIRQLGCHSFSICLRELISSLCDLKVVGTVSWVPRRPAWVSYGEQVQSL